MVEDERIAPFGAIDEGSRFGVYVVDDEFTR
jgi:hypothetical protein